MYSFEKESGHQKDFNKLEVFRDTIFAASLDDLGFSRFYFTCTNGRSDAHNIQERLDRFLANQYWMEMHLVYQVFHLTR